MRHRRYLPIAVLGTLLTACGGTVLLGSEGAAVKGGVEGADGGNGTGGFQGGGGTGAATVAGVGGAAGAAGPTGAAGTAGAGGQPRSGIYDNDAAAWCAQLSTHYATGAVAEGSKRSSWSGDQRELNSQTDFFCFLEVPDSVCVATLEASACTAPLTVLSRCMAYAFPSPELGDAGLQPDPSLEHACEEYLATPGCDGTLIRHAAVTSGPDGFDCPITYVGG